MKNSIHLILSWVHNKRFDGIVSRSNTCRKGKALHTFIKEQAEMPLLDPIYVHYIGSGGCQRSTDKDNVPHQSRSSY